MMKLIIEKTIISNQMRKTFTIILLIFIYSCQEEKKSESSSEVPIVKKEKVQKKNEVFISVNDTIKSFFTNLFVEEMQDKPDMLYLGLKHKKTSVVIPTNKPIKIVGGNPMLSYYYELNIEKGDSVLIDFEKIDINLSKQVEYPVFEITNSDRKWSELNFDNLLYKENLKTKAINIASKTNSVKSKWDSNKGYHNAIKLLDSLKSNNLISSDFYSINKLNQKIKFVKSKVNDARIQNKNLNIDSLGIELNNKNLLDNKEYINFLRAIVLFKHFNKGKRVANSVQFDFIYNNETFLNSNTRLALLESYLKSIYFIEKQNFKVFLAKFNDINTNEEFKNKWNLIVEEHQLNEKIINKPNRSVGVLTNLVNENELTFEEVLTNNRGKIVLVDFWASWCAPCRREMPYLKELTTKFNEANLKVIEISIDKDYSAWVRASKMENLSNRESSFIISNWEKTNLYKNYNIKTIPRYLLFDKEGKIIDDEAPRPSDEKLDKLIKSRL